MADQTTPAEMRETAKRLRLMVSAMERLGEPADDERAGADALERLADVIEYAEFERKYLTSDDADRLGLDRSGGRVAAYESTLRIARGEVRDDA